MGARFLCYCMNQSNRPQFPSGDLHPGWWRAHVVYRKWSMTQHCLDKKAFKSQLNEPSVDPKEQNQDVNRSKQLLIKDTGYIIWHNHLSSRSAREKSGPELLKQDEKAAGMIIKAAFMFCCLPHEQLPVYSLGSLRLPDDSTSNCH